MSACLLGEESFRQCCWRFLKLSDRLRDGWSWEPLQGSEEGYMRKTALRSVSVNSGPTWNPHGSRSDKESPASCHCAAATEQADVDGTHDDLDPGYDDGVVSGGGSRVLRLEYHILYSCSYMAPVLYFRASTLEGRSLSLDQVWSCVHPSFRSRLQRSPLTTITQQEHPLLGQPFFMLHPCKTEEFMRPVLQLEREQHGQMNYILTWLSAVGPLVGLDVPLKYSTLQPPASPPEACLQPS
ncbi:ubiquitin-like-conjugating enzyme ATG10 isoform X2 [Hippocampus comes]|uniref:Ubiquitin-like-conjugating enzyme ATG10 n=1 Tax=Hippocampus comes TaxID=109280 RepID=A0A3Q2XY50_HIPCM|nr:PREDICTED: ubiquitin-like-conjugating enzyme ATG10 isoform X2 [Hippocampus comes]